MKELKNRQDISILPSESISRVIKLRNNPEKKGIIENKKKLKGSEVESDMDSHTILTRKDKIIIDSR